MDSNQILPDDKDHRVLCGWSQNMPQKSEIADSLHVEKSKKCHITTTV